jgi:hypothetical protein
METPFFRPYHRRLAGRTPRGLREVRTVWIYLAIAVALVVVIVNVVVVLAFVRHGHEFDRDVGAE